MNFTVKKWRHGRMCTQPELTLRRDTKETDISFLTREMLIKKKTNDLFLCVCVCVCVFLESSISYVVQYSL